jgi:excisionase family DNA binding protein
VSDTLLTAEQLQQIAEHFAIVPGGQPAAGDDVWLSPDQLAQWMGVQKDWVYDQVALDALPHAKFGRQLRFHRATIQQWIKERSA